LRRSQQTRSGVRLKRCKLHDTDNLSGTTHRYEYATTVQKREGFKWVDYPKLDARVVNE
jgi:hypothetical protein